MNQRRRPPCAPTATRSSAIPKPATFPRPDPSALTTTQILTEIGHLREYMEVKLEVLEQKFVGVQDQFESRDRALTAALAAAKEAVEKSAFAMDRQIERILSMVEASGKAREAQLTDLKERMDRGEGKGSGQSATWGIVLAVIGAVVGVVGAVAVVYSLRGP